MFSSTIARLLRDESGVSALEYGLIAALVSDLGSKQRHDGTLIQMGNGFRGWQQ
jgi:hypothetical protein